MTQVEPLASAGEVSDSERGLAAAAARGDARAFTAIMRRHNRMLFRIARSILKADADAEDALQDAYLRAWRSIDGFRGDAKLSTWLARIVINESLARLRRPQRAQVIPFDGAAQAEYESMELFNTDHPDLQPDTALMRAELRRLMEACIDRLPDAYRTVFMLRAVEEMTVEEVSVLLSLPEPTVRTRLFRARALLRDRLSNDIDLAIGDAFAFAGARCDRIVAGVLARAAMPGDSG
jgi:RNA polymerase sigma-70 factor (ECF subfamily)